MKRTLVSLWLVVLAVSRTWAAPPSQDIDAYIRKAWTTLQRSVASCDAYRDTKVGAKPTLYLPHGMAVPPEVAHLRTECGVTIANLPRRISKLGDVKVEELPSQGLLYLPHPYVVPGGMFNEMYGWDSYFIIRGLLEDGQVALAKGMVENWFFEIEHYGAILNANRTYYLTRSQPPFLTSAIRAVYEKTHDRAWLKRAYGYAVRDHAMWTSAPALAGDTGLSRYFDVGVGPIPEMGEHADYYENVAAWVLSHPGSADYVQAGAIPWSHISGGTGVPITFTEGPLPSGTATTQSLTVTVSRVGTSGTITSKPQLVHLTPDYFQGDRAMRASGFDVSFRFGPFSGATHHYAAVCLNSLLYKAERDLADFARTVRPEDAKRYDDLAAKRAAAVRNLLWNAQAGMYFDYDFVASKQSAYRYATTFYPLWAGLATPEEAASVARHVDVFEQPHGLAMSPVQSGAQWDLPFGWAPVHLLAVEGMLRYNLREPALRIARKWNDTIRANYLRDGTIREKYDVVTGSSEAKIDVGYKQNVIGFGWTNAVYRVFERILGTRR